MQGAEAHWWSLPLPSSSSSLCPASTSPDCPGDGLTSSEALGGAGSEEESADKDFCGAEGPFVDGVGQYQHCPHGLGVGGAET